MEESSAQDAGKHEDEHRKKHVLVVDGNIASQFLTNLILQRLEYFSFSVKTGEDALALAATTFGRPDIVLTLVDLLLRGPSSRMKLFLHSGPGGEIAVKGKVLYCHDGKVDRVRQTGMGVKFTRITSVDSDKIKVFIRDKLREGVAVAIKA
jgi:hypothetical protein